MSRTTQRGKESQKTENVPRMSAGEKFADLIWSLLVERDEINVLKLSVGRQHSVSQSHSQQVKWDRQQIQGLKVLLLMDNR